MADEDRMTHDRDCGDDVAAYALGALDGPQADTFRRHLDGCVVCRDELTAFQQVVDVLPMSAPTYRAPASLRRRVLRAVGEEPGQLRTRERRRLALPRMQLALGGAAAALAVAVVAVVLAIGSASPSAPARVIESHVTGQGSASLRVARDRGELVVHHFAAPPAGQIYEVWLQRGAHALPTALFSVDHQGNANVNVPGSLRGVSHVLVTREPAGGTLKPTHPPVITAALD